MPPKENSLNELYEMYKNQIYTLCLRLTNSHTLAEDLFSETWVKVAEKYHNIRHEKNSMAWIYTVCINIYRKSFSKWKKSGIQKVFIEINEVDNEINAEKALIQNETLLQLQEALSKLNDKYRLPILLFYFKDLSYTDISRIMKINMSTVKFRLNYAKELLKKEMEKQQ